MNADERGWRRELSTKDTKTTKEETKIDFMISSCPSCPSCPSWTERISPHPRPSAFICGNNKSIEGRIMRWLVVMLAVAMCGASVARADLKGVTIGFSQIGAESAWRTAETESTRAEAEKRGVDLKFSDAQGKQENQIKAI